jgi:hypothetical protein
MRPVLAETWGSNWLQTFDSPTSTLVSLLLLPYSVLSVGGVPNSADLRAFECAISAVSTVFLLPQFLSSLDIFHVLASPSRVLDLEPSRKYEPQSTLPSAACSHYVFGRYLVCVSLLDYDSFRAGISSVLFTFVPVEPSTVSGKEQLLRSIC